MGRTKVAELFVGLQLDTSSFKRELKTALDRADPTLKIKVEADTSQFKKNLQTAVKRADTAVEIPVKADTKGFTRKLSADSSKAGKDAGKKFGGGFSGAMKGAIGVGAALGAGAAAVGLIKGAMGEAREAQKTAAQTAAVLKSTGGAARISAKGVDALATSISNKTGIDDEAIAASENMLLTFTNVRNETGKGNKIFNQATKTVTDMAAATGGSAVKSSVMLGKALNDPTKGISALSRVGVTFTEGQKKQIKAMQEQGNMAGAQKVILGELKKEFGGSAAAQATAADKAKVAWGNFQETLGTALMPVIDKLLTLITTKVLPAVLRMGTYIHDQLLPPILEVVHWLGDKLAPIFRTVFGFIADHAEEVKIFGFALVGVAGAFALVTGAVAAFNAVLAINPITLVIVGLAALVTALILAYKRSATFRKIVNATWAAVKKAIATAWAAIKPILRSLWGYINNTLIPLFKRLWHNIVVPAFKAIGKAISFAWKNVIKPVLKAYWLYISRVLIPVIKFLWQRVVAPAFKAIGKIISFWWKNVARPILKAWWSFITKVLVPVLRFLWHRVVAPVFTGLGKAIKNTWTNVIKPTFDAIKKGVGLIRKGFRTGVDAIKTIWGEIKEAARRPVAFVVNTLYNNGLRKAINLIKPGKDLPEVHFARGGVLPGYTPGRDVHDFYSPTGGHLALSGGEAIMRPEWTKQVGGPKAIARMNNAARKDVHHYAAGGIFRPVRRGSPGGIHDEWTGFPAVDVPVPSGTPVYAGASGRVVRSEDKTTSYGHWIQLAGRLNTLYAHLTTRLAGLHAQVAGGNLIGYSGSTGNSTGPHLHFGAQGMSPYGFFGGSTAYTGRAAGAGPGSSIFGLVGDLKKAIGSVKDGIGLMGGSKWAGWVKGSAKEMANSVITYLNNKIPDWGPIPDNPIPHFANGGIVTRATLGLIGENGPEAVIPFKKGGTVPRLTAAQQAIVLRRRRDVADILADLAAKGDKRLNARDRRIKELDLKVARAKLDEALHPNREQRIKDAKAAQQKVASARRDRNEKTLGRVRDLIKAFRAGMDSSKFVKTLRPILRRVTSGKTEARLLHRVDQLVSLQKVLTKINQAAAHLSAVRAQRREFVGSLHDTFAPNVADYASSPGGILGGLQAQLGAVNTFTGLIKRLKKAGFSNALIMQVTSLGLSDGIAAARQLLSASPADQARIRTTFNQLNNAAGGAHGQAAQLGDSLFGGSIKAAEKALKRLPGKRGVVRAMNRIGAQIVTGMNHALGLDKPAPGSRRRAGSAGAAGAGGGGTSGGGGGTSGGGGGRANGTGSFGGGVRGAIRQAAARFGWNDGEQIASIMRIVGSESTFRPKAENPTSSASGLFQLIDANARAYMGISHASRGTAFQQSMGGMRYIKARYGGPIKAWDYHRRHGVYDSGGWLERGRTLAVNNTSTREAVLTGTEWDRMERLIAAVERNGANGGGGSPLIGHAVIRENVDLDRFDRQRAYRDRRGRI